MYENVEISWTTENLIPFFTFGVLSTRSGGMKRELWNVFSTD